MSQHAAGLQPKDGHGGTSALVGLATIAVTVLTCLLLSTLIFPRTSTFLFNLIVERQGIMAAAFTSAGVVLAVCAFLAMLHINLLWTGFIAPSVFSQIIAGIAVFGAMIVVYVGGRFGEPIGRFADTVSMSTLVLIACALATIKMAAIVTLVRWQCRSNHIRLTDGNLRFGLSAWLALVVVVTIAVAAFFTPPPPVLATVVATLVLVTPIFGWLIAPTVLRSARHR